MSRIQNFRIEGAEILRGQFRNFAGAPDKYNKDGGKRYFNVIVDDEMAQDLAEDGWGVKILEPREDGDVARHYLKVNVKCNDRTEINRITRGRKMRLNEDTLEMLDTDRIEFADMTVRAYEYEPGKISAWLDALNAYVATSNLGVREDWGVEERPFD